MTTWNELTEYQQRAVSFAYNRPDRTVTSQYIAGATGRALVRKGIMVSNQPASGAYYMPYELTAAGCDLYERAHPPVLPDTATVASQPDGAGEGE